MSSKSGERRSVPDEGKRADALRNNLLPVHDTASSSRPQPSGDLDRSAGGFRPEGTDLERLHWDSWSDVQACWDVGSSQSDTSARESVLTVVCFAHKWSAEAVTAANVFQWVRDSNECADLARLFIIDAGSIGPSIQEEVARLRVGYTPAFVIYRPSGEPLEFRKRGGGSQNSDTSSASTGTW